MGLFGRQGGTPRGPIKVANPLVCRQPLWRCGGIGSSTRRSSIFPSTMRSLGVVGGVGALLQPGGLWGWLHHGEPSAWAIGSAWSTFCRRASPYRLCAFARDSEPSVVCSIGSALAADCLGGHPEDGPA
eukprot:9474994-Lingulodinium_polyedra.AAC.1